MCQGIVKTRRGVGDCMIKLGTGNQEITCTILNVDFGLIWFSWSRKGSREYYFIYGVVYTDTLKAWN